MSYAPELMRIAIAAVLISCSSPAHPVHRVGPVGPSTATAPPALTTCTDVAVILRGPVEGEADSPDAGASRVTAIASACEEGKWSAALLHCIADEADPQPCLDKLTDAQRALYDGKLVKWAEAHAPDENLGDDGADAYVDCDDALGEIAMYSPAIVLTGADGEFATAMRRREISRLCNAQGWETPVKQCLQLAKDPQSTSACEAKLPPEQLNELATRIGELETLVATTLERRKKPADCKKVVALHDADAAWKGKLDGFKPAERNKAITESRAQMTKACTAEAWTPTVRSCLVAGGKDKCFVATSFAWTFPASGVRMATTGIAECDAYVGSMDRTLACKKLPQETRDALVDSFTAMRDAVAGLRNADDATKKQMGESCKYGNDALRQVLTSAGC